MPGSSTFQVRGMVTIPSKKNQGSWQFGQEGGTALLPDAKENTVGNPDVTWETVAKQNYGIDLKMFDSRLSFTADIFFEKRKRYPVYA